MTTTSIRPGHAVSGILNSSDWGEGYSAEQCEALSAALIERFEELCQQTTGDDSICYYPRTSEIQFACHGQTTAEHHCMDPKTAWKCGADNIEWGELAHEACEWVGEHAEEIIEGIE